MKPRRTGLRTPARLKGGIVVEYLDLVDENGLPAGGIVSRSEAHEKGLPHRTAHVWVVREEEGHFQVLLQKRSMEKDSFPGMYDTSSAGHIPAGSEVMDSALRELREELGIEASPAQLSFAGTFRVRFEKEFHGKIFRDNEFANVFVYREPVDISLLTLQKSEVEEVRWFDLEDVWRETRVSRERFCVPTPGLELLRDYLSRRPENG